MGGAAKRKDRAGATRQDCSHPSAVQADTPVAKRVDALVQRHESPSPHSIRDQPNTEARIDQLAAGNHAMLALRQLANYGRRPIAGRNAFSM